MFTGLIENTGKIKNISRGKNFLLSVETKLLSQLSLGDSICVNGVCLTVVKVDNNSFSADVMEETVSKTNIKNYKPNDIVNLERALTLNTPLGGHLLTGHIDETGEIKAYEKQKSYSSISIKISQKNQIFLCAKGSIAIDGISLTVNEIKDNIFTVNTIPHTLKNTNLSLKKTGDKVNLEYDILAKYVYRQQILSQKKKKRIGEKFLKEHGFI
jgi:riboflavin synthase